MKPFKHKRSQLDCPDLSRDFNELIMRASSRRARISSKPRTELIVTIWFVLLACAVLLIFALFFSAT